MASWLVRSAGQEGWLHNNSGGGFRRCVAGAIVIGCHVLFIALFMYAARHRTQDAESEPPSAGILYLLAPSLPALTPPPSKTQPSALETQPRRPAKSRRPVSPIPAPSDPAPGLSAATASPGTAAIDWQGEAKRSAKDAIAEAAKNEIRKCDRDGTFLLPKCGKKKPKEFAWDPEPKAIGFAGPIPYIRLGKRCILGLGIFGCALGKLPGPNGDLFQSMEDPDRPRSSVPDVEDINRLPLGKSNDR